MSLRVTSTQPPADCVWRQPLDLDRGVADHFQQRLVVPDVVFARRDVEIADEDRPLGRVRGKCARMWSRKSSFWPNFSFLSAVGNVAARRHIGAMDRHPVRQPRRHVPRVAERGEIFSAHVFQRQFRQDRHAVVALLPPRHEVIIAQRAEPLGRDQLDRALAFLQAENVGRLFLQKPPDQPLAQADRVDVPGGHPASRSP